MPAVMTVPRCPADSQLATFFLCLSVIDWSCFIGDVARRDVSA